MTGTMARPGGARRRGGSSRGARRTWQRWCAAAVAAVVAVTTYPAPARAMAPVPYDEQTVHGAVFGAVVQLHDNADAGLTDALLTAELLDWRRVNAPADTQQITAHLAATRAVAAQAVPASRSDSRSRFAVAMAVLARLGQAGSSGAVLNGPVVRTILTSTVGAEGANVVPNALNLVRGGYQDAEWNATSRDVTRAIWSELHHRASTDASLAEAWDAAFAARAGTSVSATLPTLLATRIHEPRGNNAGTVGHYVPLAAIGAETGNPAVYQNVVWNQALQALSVLEQEANARIAEVIAYSNTYVVNQAPKPDAATRQAQQGATENAKKIFEGLGAIVSVLSTLVGFSDKKAAKQLETVGKAAITAATAINTYMTTVLNSGLTNAAFAMGTAVLTGNLLGAAMSLIGLFTGGDNPDAGVQAEIAKLRDQINRLAQGMTERFNRIEQALNEMYANLVAQLDALTKAVDEVRVNLGHIATVLQEIERKVDSMALATHVALENIARRDLNQVISTYVHHKENTGGQPIPDFVNTYYPLAESPTFRFATIDALQEGTFTVPSGTSLADPVSTLDLYLPEGSVNYLSQWARQRVGGSWTTGPVANAAAWNTAARVYNILQLENPQYASQVNSARATAIADAGANINTRVGEFSRPAASGATNALFVALMDDYRQAVAAWNAQVENVRRAVISNGGVVPQYEIWGSPDQTTAARIAESPSMRACSGANPTVTVPSTLRRSNLPNAFHLLDHGMAQGQRPEFSTCYDAQFVNIKTQVKAKLILTVADLKITVQSKVKWAGGAWQTVQSSAKVFPVGTICTSNNWDREPTEDCVTEESYVNSRWNTVYQPAFESAAITAHCRRRWRRPGPRLPRCSPVGRSTSTRSCSTAPGPPTRPAVLGLCRVLWQKGKAGHEAVRMLQAYTELGWATALESDDAFNALLFGTQCPARRLDAAPSDADQSASQHFRSAMIQAVQNFAAARRSRGEPVRRGPVGFTRWRASGSTASAAHRRTCRANRRTRSVPACSARRTSALINLQPGMATGRLGCHPLGTPRACQRLLRRLI